ncbi:endogenous retrovirus group K member 5 Gag polyprotein-like [Artibeus jamaicensis]|uniref:endogenous retrovirus group K member 5 Gag polyprotein-like n=1 Tax=Artibeus jamaicensis TaxID=9417 RepID=UPI00235A492F|nr:endogenous retrovirus group K member 5 Gag polyprotein-like [Artibeus jamaicensis]XP_053520693.1 endogenous retrovirus group K member 5 Gag polyprotein-like [Artibeus jamaicensis]
MLQIENGPLFLRILFPRDPTSLLIARVGFRPHPPREESPLQTALRPALRDGESIDGFSPERQIFPVLQRQNDQGQQWQDYELIPYKTLKELKLACAQYGATAPFTIATMETIASLALPPQDWKTMCKAVLTGGDYLLWLAEYHESCEQQARSEAARRLGITYEQLAGTGNFADTQQQLNFHPQAYDYIRWSASAAWKKLLKTGVRKEELSKIRQGPDEPFQDFVARLLTATQRVIGEPEAATIVVREMAFENANAACQAALRPWKGRATLNDYIKLCADIGPRYIQGITLAAAHKGQTVSEFLAIKRKGKGKPGPPGSCYIYGKMGHVASQCRDSNSNNPNAPITSRRKSPGLCPRCRRGNHWANECYSKRDREGRLLVQSGNDKRGQPRAPQLVYGAMATSSHLLGMEQKQLYPSSDVQPQGAPD